MTDVSFKKFKHASSYTSVSLDVPVKIRKHDEDRQIITIPQLFETTVKKYGDHLALASEDSSNKWTTLTYHEYWTKSRQIARAFIKLGLLPRTSCGILAISRPEWFLAQMATIFAGGVSSGIYLTNSSEAVFHILESSNATICVVDNSMQMEKVRLVRHRLPNLKSVIQIEESDEDILCSEEGYYSWSQVEAMGLHDESMELQVEERLKNIVANECIMIIYTSGTIGMPKGVMLSHDNVINLSATMVNSLPDVNYGHEVIASYLPMNHIGAQILDFFMAIWMGACVYFADRNSLKGSLLKTLTKAKPTIFFAVPRIYEKMQEKLIAAELLMPFIWRFILSTARRIVENNHPARIGSTNKRINRWAYWLASIITRRVIPELGLDRCKTFFVGAAPVPLELKKLFLSYDIKLSELYGLSEACGPSTTAFELDDLESCGKPLPGVELKLVDTDEDGQGEICIRSRMVFMGYLSEAEKTKAALTVDGWLHSGDIGYFDSKGRLYISGRKKELIITSGGENVPPVHIERLVRHELSGISNAMLIGDKRKFLTMLVTIKTDIDPDSGKPNDTLQPESLEWIKSLRLPYVTLEEILNAGPCPKVLQSIQEGINRANAKAISNAQRVQKFAILPHDFSIPTGELGPTLKLRRHIVLAKYANLLEEFYKNT